MKSSRALLVAFALVVLWSLGCRTPPAAQYRAYKDAEDVPRISVADAKKDVDAGTAMIVDARGDAAYNVEHIAGSMSMSLGGVADDHKFDPLPKGKKIIVYCS